MAYTMLLFLLPVRFDDTKLRAAYVKLASLCLCLLRQLGLLHRNTGRLVWKPMIFMFTF